MHITFKQKLALGKKIKEQRHKDGKSLRKLAAECEMSYATLNDIENGKGFPTEKVYLSLIETLNFNNKAEMYNQYAKIKKSAPPDVIDFLSRNEDVVEEVRKIREKKGEIQS